MALCMRRLLRLLFGYRIGSSSRRIVLAFALVVVAGIASSWSYLFVQVVQSGGVAKVGGGEAGQVLIGGVGNGTASWRWESTTNKSSFFWRRAKKVDFYSSYPWMLAALDAPFGAFGRRNDDYGDDDDVKYEDDDAVEEDTEGEEAEREIKEVVAVKRVVGVLKVGGESGVVDAGGGGGGAAAAAAAAAIGKGEAGERKKKGRPNSYAVARLKLPGPVIVMGMPKTGTSSLKGFFVCGGRKTSHFACFPQGGPANVEKSGEEWRICRLPHGAGGNASSAGEFPLCAVCVRRNILNGRPPLEGCGSYEVWAELDSAEHPLPSKLAHRKRKIKEIRKKRAEAIESREGVKAEEGDRKELRQLANATWLRSNVGSTSSAGNDNDDGESLKSRPLCIYPQISYMEEIHAAYPNATFVLNFRPAEKWIRSVSNWNGDKQRTDNGYLRQVLTRCDFPNLPPGKGGGDADLKAFYQGHSDRVREFVRKHPSHALVEVNIEDPDAGRVLEDAFGIPSKCWSVRNASPVQAKAATSKHVHASSSRQNMDEARYDQLRGWKRRLSEMTVRGDMLREAFKQRQESHDLPRKGRNQKQKADGKKEKERKEWRDERFDRVHAESHENEMVIRGDMLRKAFGQRQESHVAGRAGGGQEAKELRDETQEAKTKNKKKQQQRKEKKDLQQKKKEQQQEENEAHSANYPFCRDVEDLFQ